MARLAKEAMAILRKKGVKAGLLRPISVWPFPEDIIKRLTVSGKRVTFLVVEMSYGQMVEDVRLAVDGRAHVEFLGRSGGGIPSEEEIINKTVALLNC